MRPRRLVFLLLLPLFALALAAGAQQPDEEMRRLREALAALQLEQQSVYQQFQMVQGLRAGQVPPPGMAGALVYTPPATPPNFNDVARERDAFVARQAQYGEELERLYARFREIEERKRPLLDRMAEIAATAP